MNGNWKRRLERWKAKRVGILGGTFNPIHDGHIMMCRTALKEFKLDAILILPAGQPPHKRDRKIASKEDRLAMIELAIEDDARIIVSDIELKRKNWTYTIDTLQELHKQLPDITWFYIIGSDTLLTLDQWYKYPEMMQYCNFIDFLRDDRIQEEDEQVIHEKYATYQSQFFIASARPPAVSSSKITQPFGERSVPLKVKQYMEEKKLYD